jgi:flagellar assembly factor FliW
MKVLTEPNPFETAPPTGNELILPQGIIGFPQHTRAELLFSDEHLPFIWMRLHGPETLHFVVVEPGGLVQGYEPELFDEDAAQLGITDPADAMILNIVTLGSRVPAEATVNLIGPLIVNRHTRVGRQRVIANHSRYSARHPLVGGRMAAAV